MENRLKTGLLVSLVLTIVTMGLFGISTVPMVDDVFAEQDKEGKNSNIKGNPDATTTPISNPCTELPEKDKPKTDKHKK